MKKILIASGDKHFWDTFNTSSQEAWSKFSIKPLYRGGELLEQLSFFAPTLLILDTKLPDVEHFAVLAAISRDFASLPIIVISPWASRLMNIHLENIGSLRVAKKPVKSDYLLNVTNKLIRYAEDDATQKGISPSAFLYLLDIERRDCQLKVSNDSSEQGLLDIHRSKFCGASCSDQLVGKEAALQIISWKETCFEIRPEVIRTKQNSSGVDISELVIEGIGQREDRQRRTRLSQIEKMPEVHPAYEEHLEIEEWTLDGEESKSIFTSTEVLQQLMNVPKVQSVAIIARDGFVVESLGSIDSDRMEMVGASVGVMLNGIDGLITELALEENRGVVLEYECSMIICRPVGEALLTVLSSSSDWIAQTRKVMAKHLPLLAEMF